MSHSYNHSGAGPQNNNTGSGNQYNSNVTGDNNIVYNTHQTSRPTTPPKPFFNQPYILDPDYVERSDLQQRLQAKVPLSSRRVALVGMGGVGKTQSLFHHALRLRRATPDLFIFWLHASNTERFDESVKDIVERLRIPGGDDPSVDPLRLLNLLKNWLAQDKYGRWLIVLDGADDADVLNEPPEEAGTRGRIDYFPVCSHGAVVLTTRSAQEARKLGVDRHDILAIGAMQERDAVAMLAKRLSPTANRQSLTNLARSLDHIPLALAQASAYIDQLGAACTVEKYIELMQAARLRIYLFEENDRLSGRDREADNSVLLTLQITFRRIEQTRRSAFELLALMSWSDCALIPDWLFHPRNGICKDTLRHWKIRMMATSTSVEEEEDSILDLQYRRDVSVLADYSLIAGTNRGAAWRMHQVVQDAVQYRLKNHSSRTPLVWRFLTRLAIKIPFRTAGQTGEDRARILFQHLLFAYGLNFYQGQSLLLRKRLESVVEFCWTRLRVRRVSIILGKNSTPVSTPISRFIFDASETVEEVDSHISALRGSS